MFEALIKAQLKALGLDEGLWNKITAATEAEIPTAVMKFAVERGVQSETDRRVTQAVQTREAALKVEHEAAIAALKGETGKGTDTGTGTGTGAGQPDIAAIITEAVKPFADRIAALESNRVSDSRAAKIKDAVKAAGLPEAAEKYIRVDTDDQIAHAVADYKKDADAFKQADIDARIQAGDLAAVKHGTAGQTIEEAAIKNYASSLGKNGAVKNPDFPGRLSSTEAEPAKADT